MDLELSRDELDLPPEYCKYRDEGCEFAKSCLNCPLPRCIYDEPGGKQRWRKGQRDREIVRLFYVEGKGAKEQRSWHQCLVLARELCRGR